MSNVLTDFQPDNEAEKSRAERVRFVAESRFQPSPPVDQSAVSMFPRPQVTDGSNVIPAAIAACWHLLKQSHLGDEARLISAALRRITQPRMGLASLSATSLDTFLHFWIAVRAAAAEPEIAISPKGNIQAEWTKDDDDFLVLEFQPTGEVFYSLWQGDYPMEGAKSSTMTHELVNMFNAMDENPLCWSDAA